MVDTGYITKESALSCFHDWIDRYGHEHSADEMAEYQRIEDLLPADVVEVVRCKDCIHDNSNDPICPIPWVKRMLESFCSFGERRSDNG